MSATTIPAPDRTAAQRLEALKRANQIRSHRARLKRAIRERQVSVLDVLADPPDYAHTMKVWDLLVAVPKIGDWKARRTLHDAGVSPSKTLAGVSPRQRVDLLSRLERYR